MKSFVPEFKDDTDKIITVAMFVTSIFFIFIPALVVILLLKEQISESSYEITKAFLNFEIIMFLISLLFLIPIVGWLVGVVGAPILAIVNIVIIVLALCGIAKGSEIKIPVPYEFI